MISVSGERYRVIFVVTSNFTEPPDPGVFEKYLDSYLSMMQGIGTVTVEEIKRLDGDFEPEATSQTIPAPPPSEKT